MIEEKPTSSGTKQNIAQSEQRTTMAKFDMEPFNKGLMQWARWVKRFEGAMSVFEVKSNNKKAMLLHYMGVDSYNLLCDHISPEEPEDKTYEQIVKCLDELFDPKPLEMVELWKFRQRLQTEGETVTEFITALQKVAANCDFGQYLTKALRNQLVFGVRNPRIRNRLIEERNLTLEKAKQIALAMEAAGDGAEVLNSRSAEVLNSRGAEVKEVNIVSNTTKKNVECYRCGESHFAYVCKHKRTVCKKCGKIGHLQRVCRTNNRSKSVRLIDEQHQDSEENEEVNSILINNLYQNANHTAKIYITLKVNNTKIQFEVDSGSPFSIISMNDKQRWFKDIPIRESDIKLQSYCGGSIKLFGTISVIVENAKTKLTLFVVESKRGPIVGRTWMRDLKFDWNELLSKGNSYVNQIVTHSNTNQEVIKKLKEEFEVVFRKSLGEISNIQASLILKENALPIFLKNRTIPFALKESVEKEINDLVNQGILIKVNRSEWATPIVPVKKSGNRVRLCGDYKLTVNKNLVIDEFPLPTIEELFANMAGGEKFSKIDLAQAYLQMIGKPEH